MDSSKAKTDIKDVKVQLVIRPSVRANGRLARICMVLNEQNLGSMQCGDRGVIQMTRSANLNIQTEGTLQATCSGKLIENWFETRVVCSIDGYLCYSEHPFCKNTIAVYNVSPNNNLLYAQQNEFRTRDVPFQEVYNCEFQNTKMNADFSAHLKGSHSIGQV